MGARFAWSSPGRTTFRRFAVSLRPWQTWQACRRSRLDRRPDEPVCFTRLSIGAQAAREDPRDRGPLRVRSAIGDQPTSEPNGVPSGELRGEVRSRTRNRGSRDRRSRGRGSWGYLWMNLKSRQKIGHGSVDGLGRDRCVDLWRPVGSSGGLRVLHTRPHADRQVFDAVLTGLSPGLAQAPRSTARQTPLQPLSTGLRKCGDDLFSVWCSCGVAQV